ncbi:2,3-bisphosphoglycerate-dependent phosphoglycerate mutase [Nitrosomonas halophila]|uniref:2,3-bisphosphoglycerate-dependent phosphoglycerate mutase n=1 Tax=Nitrosomonas halophila TaxID=44576 RepID=A0A1H3MVU6_9PROT|nr:2,3-bisphosphoglycerate-dependent phosphoglycerate mutase [Nitrosomonas halophila]SDY80608.1 2,3-bisphosphoglycerate-dependent phosphoglycerate mutase [Nitrosomonas halophila]
MNEKQKLTRLVLLRHGQSIWNRDRHFTGWSNVALSPAGEEEARAAGQLLKQAGFTFDACLTSGLRRAQDTLALALSTMGQQNLPVYRSWRLNERHYGALEGMQRWAAIRRFGLWSIVSCQIRFNASPPCLALDDLRAPVNQPCYASVDRSQLPLGESMQHTLERVLPLWQNRIVPEIRAGKRLLIVSHKNLLKTLVMQLEGLTGLQVMRLSIATGRPLCYELDASLRPVRRYYLSALNDGARKAAV